MTTTYAAHPGRLKRLVSPGGLIDKYFYLFMSLLVTTVVVSAFSRSIDHGLLHPAFDPPVLLWVHGIVFFAWILFFVLQSALVRVHRVKLHMLLGWYFAGLGAMIPVLGISITRVIYRIYISQLHVNVNELTAFSITQWLDMVGFTVAFGLAILLRKRPEYHRRLVLLAACTLTAAAFGRLPHSHNPYLRFYLGVDGLILLGVLRDLLINRRVHPAYAWFVPSLVLLQLGAVFIWQNRPEWWLRIGRAFIGQTG
jgi:Na+-transporting NADH:ubiquinone oxidoreductase subunit NqrE